MAPRKIIIFMIMASSLLLSLRAFAEEGNQLRGFEETLARLSESELAGLVEAELGRSESLIDGARQALESGDERTYDAIILIIPLQLRLVDELLRAAADEHAADEAERELLLREEERRALRDALDRVLERLILVSPRRGGGL